MRKLGWTRRLIAVLFPERCACCGKVVRVGEGCCPSCRRELSIIGTPVCPFCGLERPHCRCRQRRAHYERVIAPFYYEGAARNGILRLKRCGRAYVADFFADAMAEKAAEQYDDVVFTAVTYVPMTAAAEAARGHNQSEQLARALGRRLGLPVVTLLDKLIETVPQKELPADLRGGNVLGVFDPRRDPLLQGGTILLVDDIVTTGSTLNECAKMLKIGGADAVYALAATAALPESDKKQDILHSSIQNGG